MSESTDLREEAFNLVRTWWRAWVEGDESTVAAMLHPEFAELNERREFKHLGGRTTSGCKEAMCIDSWDIFDPVTKLFPHTIVCTYSFRISGTRAGQPFSLAGYATDVMLKQSGGWFYVSHHGTLQDA